LANAERSELIMRFSFIEIYKENISDLLSPDNKSLDIKEHPEKGTQLLGATEVEVESTSQVIALLKLGSKNRAKEEINGIK